jgi:hypothetical protein
MVSFDCFTSDQKEACSSLHPLQPPPANTQLYAALELSKKSWLLAIQIPGRDDPSLHPITGGDADGLVAKRDAAREHMARAGAGDPRPDT